MSPSHGTPRPRSQTSRKQRSQQLNTSTTATDTSDTGAALVIGGANNPTSANVLAGNITLSGDVDLRGTGITGFTRDNGGNDKYTGTLDGGEHTITLAIGEAYGKKSDGTNGAEEDPREELVISLMRYKRCRVFANELRERRAKYEGARFRTRMTAKELGIDTKKISSDFEKDEFEKAIDEINNRNELRFNDISAKIKHILRRDKISVKERMKSLWLTITKKGKLFFSELFKGKKVEKIDRIVSFLAILELVRNNDITAEQKGSFEDILIEEKRK